MALDKQTGLRTPSLHRNILITALVMFAGIIIAAVIRLFSRRSLGTGTDSSVTAVRRLMIIVALLQLAFVGVVFLAAQSMSVAFVGAPTSLKIGLAFPVIGLLLTLVAAWFVITEWRRGEGALGTRLRQSITVLVALFFFWSLNTWNLLGWKV
jgi:hypothetical protein